jgi:hypothetical protein
MREAGWHLVGGAQLAKVAVLASFCEVQPQCDLL